MTRFVSCSRFVLPIAAILAAIAVFSSQSSSASPFVPYTAEAFAKAQEEGRTILVDVFAPWCPTCRRQKPILEAVAEELADKGVMAMQVNWDEDKDFIREHRIPRQSTVLVFQGTRETARSIAETNEDALRAVILSGVNAE